MGAQALERFVIGLLIVGLLIVAFALAQGIGESVGHGISEVFAR